ncbi:MAG: hypothetical protein WBA57_22165 [Elainellaceae cyanobacterium]
MRLMSWIVISITAIAMMTGCAGNQTESSEESVSELEEQSIEASPDGAIALEDRDLPEATPIPLLTPPTSPELRASQVQTRQSDPFSPLPSTPIVVPTRVASPAPPRPLVQPTTVPVSAGAPLPPIPLAAAPVPVQAPSAAAPTAQPQPVAVAPPAPTAPPVVSLLESIEVSGVVQVGGQTSVIVRVPTERSSRTASVGDRIANGQVLLKRIDLAGGGDPIVVLEQNGIEVTRSVSLLGG